MNFVFVEAVKRMHLFWSTWAREINERIDSVHDVFDIDDDYHPLDADGAPDASEAG